MNNTRKAVLAGGLVLALSGVGAAAALAANASENRTPAAHANQGPKPKAQQDLARNVLHGELVVDRNGKTVTLELQTGTVQSATADSISILSKDGFTATYAITAATKKNLPAADQGTPKTGETLRVQAVKDGATLTAERIAIVKSPRKDKAKESHGKDRAAREHADMGKGEKHPRPTSTPTATAAP